MSCSIGWMYIASGFPSQSWISFLTRSRMWMAAKSSGSREWASSVTMLWVSYGIISWSKRIRLTLDIVDGHGDGVMAEA